MGNFMMYSSYIIFCIIFLLVVFALIFKVNKTIKWIILGTVTALLISLIFLYRTGSDIRRENISPLQYGAIQTNNLI